VANAQVEKLKALGLRHGEKAVVGLASALCLLFLVFAVTKETIDLTPEQVDKDAKSAQSNIDRKQNTDDILKIIEDANIKNPGFEKLVDSQEKSALKATDYVAALPWVTPEPGAGLIRDKPELIAPTDLIAYPGRGGALVYELDEAGKRIPDKGEQKADETTKVRRTRKRNRSSMMAGGYGGMMAGMGMGGPPPDSEEAKKQRELENKRLQKQLAGKVGPEAEKKEGEEAPADQGPWKETTKGLRWVAITGVLDHDKMKKNWVNALKRPEAAPNYKRLEVQRQVRQPDGTWPGDDEWETVDFEKNRLISWNLPETEEELVSDDAILNFLVDPLPFLKAGLWEKVHIASLVPKEKREIKAPEAGGPGMMGGGYGGMMSGPGMMGGGGPPGGYERMMRGGSGMMMAGGMMGGGYGGGAEENQDFQKTEAKTVMVRSLDFTVEPDTTYRFRVAVVVFNPNYGRDDVSPGTDTTSKELIGPYSAPTDAVTMPADVTAYAMNKSPSGPGSKRTDQVSFQVVRWNPESGWTVTRNFEAGPGEVIGDPATTAIPNSEGKAPDSKLVDYNSHNVVLDTAGGPKPIDKVGATGAPLDAPAVALLLRPDGSVVLRGEYFDQPDTVRKDIEETYRRELKDSNDKKKRQSSFGGYGGMMGAPGGMMGGYGGRRGGR
jgi:hypothetical protein